MSLENMPKLGFGLMRLPEKENSGSWERGVYTVGGDGLPRLVK